jgi:ABC-type lipoprotein release transport system permease subunit
MTAKRLAMTREVTGRRRPAGIHPAQLSRQLRPEELAKLKAEKKKDKYRNVWIIIISLVVTVIGISNAMLMSVTERFREIGTMKCLGALSAFVRQIFLIESCMIGAMGGIVGSIAGSFFTIMIYAFTFGFGLVATSLAESVGKLLVYLLLAFCAGVVLSIVAAIYPANVASKMVPANALRSNV